MSAQEHKRSRIVIVGGGVAGLQIATRLGKAYEDVGEIVLIDKDFAHIWKPTLHTVAAGTSDVYQQQTTFIAQASRAGFTYLPGEMTGIDRDKQEVLLGPVTFIDGRVALGERRVHYDVLIMAVGSQANDFGTPGVAKHCWMIDSREQAKAFSREVRLRMLQCALEKTPLSIAIVGGGATGVELAAQLVQLAQYIDDYVERGVARNVKITLVESGDHILAAFREKVSIATCAKLEELGVKVRLSTRVTQAGDKGYTLSDGSLLEADLMVWAAGVKAPAFMFDLGLPVSRIGQLTVKQSLQSVEDDKIFVVGDCASLTLPGETHALPPTAQIAHQQAKHLIRYLPQWLKNKTPIPPFVPQDRGALVSLGRYDAFGSLGKFGLIDGGFIEGRLAQFSHHMLYRSHQVALHGFWRGTLLWFVDQINAYIRPKIRLD